MANKTYRIVPSFLPDANNQLTDQQDYQIQIRNGVSGQIMGLTSVSPQVFSASDSSCTSCEWVTLTAGSDYDYYEIVIEELLYENLQARYRARDHALNISGWSEWGNTITVYCDFENITQTTVASGASSVSVNWTAAKTDWIEKFEIIRRNLTSGSVTTITVSNPDSSSYIDASVEAGVTYTYQIRVTCFTGESQTYDLGSTGLCDFGSIGNFRAVFNSNTGNVDVIWANTSVNVDWIDSIVLHKNNITDGVTGDISISPHSAITYTDSNVQLGKTYGYSLEVTCDTYSQVYNYPNITICNFSVFETITLSQEQTGITVQWIKPSPEIWDWIDKVLIYRNGTLIDTLNTITGNTYLDSSTNLDFGRVYSYRLEVHCIDGRIRVYHTNTLRYVSKCNVSDLTTLQAIHITSGIQIKYGPLASGNEWIESIKIEVRPTYTDSNPPAQTPTMGWVVDSWNTFTTLPTPPDNNVYVMAKENLDPNFNYQFRLTFLCIDGITYTELTSNVLTGYSADFRIIKLSDGITSKRIGIPYIQQLVNEVKSTVERCMNLADLCDVDTELSLAIHGSNSASSTNPFATINDVLNNIPSIQLSDLEDISEDAADSLLVSLSKAVSQDSQFATVQDVTEGLIQLNVALEDLTDVTPEQSAAFRAMLDPAFANPVMTKSAVVAQMSLTRLSQLRYMTENIERALLAATSANNTNPFATILDVNNAVSTIEFRDLTNITSNMEAAVVSSLNPSADNPFTTVSHAMSLVDTATTNLASKLGESVTAGTTTFGSAQIISSGMNHNVAIAKLDSAVYSAWTATASQNKKITNIGMLIGESVVTSSVTWSNPKYISLHDTHHSAIVKLDTALSNANSKLSQLDANTGANRNGAIPNYTITNAAIVNGITHHVALGRLQGQFNSIENLTYFKNKVGENITSAPTDYASTRYIADGDSHHTAIGKLDVRLSNVGTSINNIFQSKLDMVDNNSSPSWTVNNKVINTGDKIFPALNKINTHISDIPAARYKFAINVWGNDYTTSVDLWANIVSAASLTYADGTAVGANYGQNEVVYDLSITNTDAGKLKIKRIGTTGSKIQVRLLSGAETINGDDKTTSSNRDAVRITNASYNSANGAYAATVDAKKYTIYHDQISRTPTQWVINGDGTPFVPNNILSTGTFPTAANDIDLKTSGNTSILRISSANVPISTLVISYRYKTDKYWTIQGVANMARHFNNAAHGLETL